MTARPSEVFDRLSKSATNAMTTHARNTMRKTPRRVAARAAAERMAAMLGEKPGETIGYLTRLDSKRSAKTRVTVLTEAIFLNRIVADPELPGVSAVLFDEAHERHLDSDFGLALALETQGVLREDLRLLVMSATLDGERFAGLMNDCPVIESEGRSHPLEIQWLGSSGVDRFEDAMADAVAQVEAHGYRTYFLDRRRRCLLPFSQLCPEIHSRPSSADYVYNYLFLPR